MHSAQQIPLDLGARPALGRADFLISCANRDAVEWIDRWPDWSTPTLILSGPVASGKSHLAAVWQDKTGAKVIHPDTLLSQNAQDIANTAPSLIFDGLDPWLGDRAAEETLFHLYNMFKEEKRSFLITMRMAPSAVLFAIPDLSSRLRAAPLAMIHAPDDDLLSAILIKLFHDRQLAVSADVIQYILPRMERSFSSVRDLVERADHRALAQKRKISIPLMRDVLAGMQEA